MGEDRRRLLTLSEIGVVIGVFGILISIAVPSYMRMKSHSRMERLLESVASCQEEMPRWFDASVLKTGVGPKAGTGIDHSGAEVVVTDEIRNEERTQ